MAKQASVRFEAVLASEGETGFDETYVVFDGRHC
jgi:hypothetical protein